MGHCRRRRKEADEHQTPPPHVGSYGPLPLTLASVPSTAAQKTKRKGEYRDHANRIPRTLMNVSICRPRHSQRPILCRPLPLLSSLFQLTSGAFDLVLKLVSLFIDVIRIHNRHPSSADWKLQLGDLR